MTATRPITVLIVDDFAKFRQVVRSKLEANGFQIVAEASDGLEAVTKAAELQPDVVLLDIAMPNLDGIEAAARIRTISHKSKILFVSHTTDPDTVQAVLGDRGHGFVGKFKVNSHLLPAIDAVLNGVTVSII
ncbi:MAG TPA: response regulator transcription factor [Candidatus Sulfotelmatobacter sp.]|nr:response regulator transcription factor [Candidatus Sulfotelmatobacter sp.]